MQQQMQESNRAKRLIAYVWFCMVMGFTSPLPDVIPVLKLRGFLLRCCFRSCGANFQIASNVKITFTTRVALGNDVYIAPGCWIQGVGGVTLGDEVMLGPYTVLASNDHTKQDGSYRFGPGSAAPISMGRGSWTGAHTVITAGMHVGAGAAVAAGGVVVTEVPDHAVVGGVPARVIKQAEDA